MSFAVPSIQSHAAAFALQRLGIKVWPVHTVQFSSHPHHGAWTGQAFAAAHVRSRIGRLDARGYLRGTSEHIAGDDRINALAVTAERTRHVGTPYIPLAPMLNGIGKRIAAVFLGRYLQRHDTGLALSHSVSSLQALVRGTDVGMPRDLNLISMQDALVRAPEVFAAELV